MRAEGSGKTELLIEANGFGVLTLVDEAEIDNFVQNGEGRFGQGGWWLERVGDENVVFVSSKRERRKELQVSRTRSCIWMSGGKLKWERRTAYGPSSTPKSNGRASASSCPIRRKSSDMTMPPRAPLHIVP